ncbi:MAG: membrane protein insertase YidC [Pseudomonadota bacterium]
MNKNNLNLIAAIVLSIGIMAGWQYFYERPRLAESAEAIQQYNNQMEQIKETQLQTESQAPATRSEAVAQNKRIPIISEALRGSISLKGARFDDLTLMNYKETIDKNSPNVSLLSPASSSDAYFAEMGWHSKSPNLILPNDQTIFTSDKEELTPDSPITLSWTSPDNIVFMLHVAVDKDYMFTIKQSVVNNSNAPISLEPYGLINRSYTETEKAMQILHQGPIAAINGELKEHTFSDIKDKKTERLNNANVDWIGITDKYWLTAFIPDQASNYNASFSYAMQNAKDKFQVDFLGKTQIVEQGNKFEVTNYLFAGAKKVGLLDKYEEEYNIKLFDRAIDFGMFYVLTKPVFNALNFFYKYCGNFGISILIVTVIVKLAMLTMSSRSYRAMKKMKALQPEIDRLKSLYADDKAKFNQEIMELYKREKVNPVAGCLPMLIQIPVFFSLYKVLYVTIEMRHAPFFGWIKDLSAPDPTTVFNLFGLLSFTPPSFLMIGIWPLLMAGTMYMQQRMSPEPADPVQAKVMRFMPLMFLFMFGNFPAGLLIYWTWNNILSMGQQYYINRLEGKAKK